MARCILLIALLSFTGCQSARYVHVTPEGGVVAIPENTNNWPSYHRDKAEALIKKNCPNGFDIVTERETVVGQVTRTNSQTDTEDAPTLLLGGREKTATKKGDIERASEGLAGVAVPIGETRQTTEQTVTSRDVTEWRITYRRK